MVGISNLYLDVLRKQSGEMARLIHEKDWTLTAVGAADKWPQCLRTCLNIILHSKFPMFLFWGEELICFYNDAYRPSLGKDGKHPEILGMRGEEAWKEIWPVIKPLIDSVLAGNGATWSEDQLIPIYRNGRLEDVYWTFSYSPVCDDCDVPTGVFVTCTETTEKVLNVIKLEETQLQLRDSAQNLRNIILQAPVAMCILKGNDFVVEVANDRMLEFWGKTQENVINKPVFEGIPEGKGQGFEEMLNGVYHTGKTFKAYDQPIKLSREGNLENLYVDFVYEAFREPDGTISGIMAVAIDVTDQVIARKKIEDSEREFRELADSLPQMVWTSDAHGHQTFASKKWEEFTGLNPYDKEARRKMIHPADWDHLMDVWGTALKSETAFTSEVRLINRKSEYIWFFVHGEPIKNESGIVEKWVGAYSNIHEQKMAEENLRLTSQRFSMLADAMPEFVWIGDATGNLNYFNKAVYTYSGLSVEQIAKEGWVQIVHPDEREGNLKSWMNAIATGKDFVFSHRFRRHDGEYRWHLSRAMPQPDINGEIQFWVGSSTDIQEMKEMDQQKDNFLSMASHELKTPVTTIKAYGQIAESMLEKKGDYETLVMIQQMSKQVNKLKTLIEDLLDISKIQQGKMMFEETQFDFNELLLEVVDDMQKTSSTHHIKTITDASVNIYGAKDKLSQVINNLISNAIKYSPSGREVIVSTERTNNGILLNVRDFGIGIASKDHSQVFRRFFRVAGENQSTFPGMGIGLFICSEIVKEHGGKIGVDSSTGDGSTFHIWLPVDHRLK